MQVTDRRTDRVGQVPAEAVAARQRKSMMRVMRRLRNGLRDRENRGLGLPPWLVSEVVTGGGYRGFARSRLGIREGRGGDWSDFSVLIFGSLCVAIRFDESGSSQGEAEGGYELVPSRKGTIVAGQRRGGHTLEFHRVRSGRIGDWSKDQWGLQG